MGKKHHGPPHEEHPDETWLVPYADLLTLLLALFIVLFATAKVDKDKFAQVAVSLNSALGGGAGPFNGAAGASILSGGVGVATGPGSTPTSVMSPAELENAQLEKAKSEIEAFIKSAENLPVELEAISTDQGLLIRIRDTGLYPSGSAQITPEIEKFARLVSGILGTMPQNVLISGHTDNIPINTTTYPSNWELSADRAVNLMKYLLRLNPSLNPARFSAVGFGEHRPVMTNDTAEGRSRNRRVEILIQKKYPEGSETATNTLINPAEPGLPSKTN